MKLEIPSGGMIHDAAQFAINEAQHRKESVQFDFNGIELTAYPQSYARDIVVIYGLEHTIRRMKLGLE